MLFPGLSDASRAEALGCTPETYSRVKQGRRPLSDRMILRVQQAATRSADLRALDAPPAEDAGAWLRWSADAWAHDGRPPGPIAWGIIDPVEADPLHVDIGGRDGWLILTYDPQPPQIGQRVGRLLAHLDAERGDAPNPSPRWRPPARVAALGWLRGRAATWYDRFRSEIPPEVDEPGCPSVLADSIVEALAADPYFAADTWNTFRRFAFTPEGGLTQGGRALLRAHVVLWWSIRPTSLAELCCALGTVVWATMARDEWRSPEWHAEQDPEAAGRLESGQPSRHCVGSGKHFDGATLGLMLAGIADGRAAPPLEWERESAAFAVWWLCTPIYLRHRDVPPDGQGPAFVLEELREELYAAYDRSDVPDREGGRADVFLNSTNDERTRLGCGHTLPWIWHPEMGSVGRYQKHEEPDSHASDGSYNDVWTLREAGSAEPTEKSSAAGGIRVSRCAWAAFAAVLPCHGDFLEAEVLSWAGTQQELG
jgi:hypothetical protein